MKALVEVADEVRLHVFPEFRVDLGHVVLSGASPQRSDPQRQDLGRRKRRARLLKECVRHVRHGARCHWQCSNMHLSLSSRECSKVYTSVRFRR